MNRRGFLGTILAAAVAPAIVRADSLMRVIPVDTGILAAPSITIPAGALGANGVLHITVEGFYRNGLAVVLPVGYTLGDDPDLEAVRITRFYEDRSTELEHTVRRQGNHSVRMRQVTRSDGTISLSHDALVS